MTYIYRNFRSTQAYYTPQETAPDAWVDAAIDYQAGVNSFGMVSSNPVASNRTTAASIQVAGNLSLGNFADQFRQNLANGNYRFRLACSATGLTNVQSICIWDGALVDGATVVGNGNSQQILSAGAVVYPDGVNVTANRYAVIEGRLYFTSNGGTTTNASKPTHESGTVVGADTISWRFVKKALVWAFNASVNGSTHVMDAAGATHTLANWLANNAPSAFLAVTQGFITVTRSSETGPTLRSIGFELQPTPLGPITLKNEKGVAMGVAPLLYTAQPAGKPVAQLMVSTGATDNIVLGGTLAPYFTLQTYQGGLWLFASSTPMPDSVAASNDQTLTLTQTDGDPLVSGSPCLTTFSEALGTLNVVSSQGKPTSLLDENGNEKAGHDRALVLISTESWLRYKFKREMVEASWNGHTGQEIDFSRPVTNDIELGNALTAASAAAGAGVWQEIVLNGGTYSTFRGMPTTDFAQGGTGGLLIRRGTGSPVINAQWVGDAFKGWHFHQLTFVPNGPDDERILLQGRATHGTPSPHEVLVTDCDFGTIGQLGIYSARFDSGKSARFRGNRIKGVSVGFNCAGTRCVEIGNNDMRESNADFIDLSTFPLEAGRKGVYADDHVYVWIYDNTYRMQNDDYEGYTDDVEPHADFIQLQQSVLQWAPGKNYPATAQSGAFWCMSNGNFYTTTTGGVSGGNAPTHGAGTVSDGVVAWTFHSTIANGPTMFGLVYGNRAHSGGLTYSDLTPQQVDSVNPVSGKLLRAGFQFWIDSMRGAGSQFTVFDNLAATCSDKGFYSELAPTDHRIECNTFAAANRNPVIADPAPNSGSAGQTVLNAHVTGSGVYSRKNVCGQNGTGIHHDNLIVKFKGGEVIPSTYLRGTFIENPHPSNGTWEYPTMSDEQADPAQFVSALESFLLTKNAHAGYGAISSVPGQITLTVSFTLTGGDGGSAGISLPFNLAAQPGA